MGDLAPATAKTAHSKPDTRMSVPENPYSGPSLVLVFAIIFAVVCLLHTPLLRLPYFWDEAGYYIPAARDLLLTGSVIPHSVPSNAHPPLVMAWLALAWKLAGFSPLVTRIAMLAVAAFALLGELRLAMRVANFQVAVAATLCTALYPVFFAQSALAHVDLAAGGLTFWALDSYLGGRPLKAALWFSLAALAKETAILAPVALLLWECVCPWIGGFCGRELRLRPTRWSHSASLLAPVLVLGFWYAYHGARTGYVFGNPDFFRYNVGATINPLRVLLALGMRAWQSFGYLHLWVLTLLMAWAMTRPPWRHGDTERPRIAVPVQLAFGVVILAYVTGLAVVGGAVLARYMLPAVPLVVILTVSTLWRRMSHWPAVIAIGCAAFVAGWYWNPPYGFSPEDNLAYRDYIEMHQDAARFLEQRYPAARVLTAWPASDEIARPYLGYVVRPLRVARIRDFTVEEIVATIERRSRFDVALVFSTKYQPPHPLLANRPWLEGVKTRLFGFHRDLLPEVIAGLLGGHVVMRERRAGQWIALIEVERLKDARVERR
jgi:hypothetical protein